jgi:hypothetical protein
LASSGRQLSGWLWRRAGSATGSRPPGSAGAASRAACGGGGEDGGTDDATRASHLSPSASDRGARGAREASGAKGRSLNMCGQPIIPSVDLGFRGDFA